MGTDSISRTFIGSVVCVDLVGYSTKSVAQQITIKEAFNRLLAQSLQRVAPEDRIILDTGDGAAVSFLGDPEGGLQCALALRDSAASHAAELGAAKGQGAVRIGVNLGPMKVALDLNGYPRIVGDGINVAERIAAFAQPGEIVVSRSFHDMVSRLSESNSALFADGGTRADKNGREHHVFTVTSGRRAAASRPAAAPSVAAPGGGGFAAFLRDRLKVGFAATLLGVLIAVELAVIFFGAPRERAPVVANPEPRPAPVQTPPAPAPKVEPAPVVAARTPDFVKLPEPAPPKVEPAPAPTYTKAPEAAAAKPAEPAPPKATDPPRAVVPEPVRTPPAEAPRAAPVDPPKPAKREEPRKREDPKAAAKREEPPKPVYEPPKPAPEPPREEPKVALAPPPTTIATPVSKSQVSFPAQAMARNIDRGLVKARLTIDAAGKVSSVQIVSSFPRRYFDDEATRSLKEWRFNAGADNRTYDVEIEFQR